MLDLLPVLPANKTLTVLCIGAHCDDIEIGCGASLLALQQRRRICVEWATLSGSDVRRRESLLARKLLVKPAARGGVTFGDFRDGRLPAQYAQVKEFFEQLKRSRPVPDVVLCHERSDRHQDHRIVNEMVWNTYRDHLVLEYEIPKWDGGLGEPNVYIAVSRRQAESKVKALMRAYGTQVKRDWFTPETFMGLMRLRGIECRAPGGYAEAFHGRKLRLGGY